MFASFEVTPSFLLTVLLACNQLQPSKTQVNCNDYPCFNGGTCIRGPPDMCSCPAGYFQPFCTTSCLNAPCVNSTCVGDVCNCDTNLAGPTCESAIAAYLSPLEITVTEGHVGQKEVIVQVCRQPSSEEVTLAVYTLADSASASALPGVDFVNIPMNPGQDVTISAGQTCTPVNVVIISDLDQEMMSKDFGLVLIDPQLSSMFHFVSGNALTTITIIDDDPEDTIPPTISGCPSDLSVVIELGIPYAVVVWTEPTATDISGTVVLISHSHVPGERFRIGMTTVVYIFSDETGNAASCSFSVTVTTEDTTPPRIANCPSLIERQVELGIPGLIITWIEPSATDNSGIAILVDRTDPPNSFFPVGTTRVMYTFRDSSRNEAVCLFRISITTVDTTPPECVNLPDFVSENTELGNPGRSVTWIEPTCKDISNIALVTARSNLPGSFFFVGDTVVTYTCTDGSGNSDTCSFTVQVITNMEPPTIHNCPDDISVTAPAGAAATTVSWTPPTATDLSGAVTLTSSQNPGDSFTIGSTQVTYTAIDGADNMAFCRFTVTVLAGEPPPSSTVYLVALVIPVLLIIILLVVIIKRIRRKPASEPKPVDVQDVDYVNAGVTDDPGDYIALEEQSKNTPKYQDLTEKEAPTQVSGYERTILETADAAPKAMPHQGLKRQTDGDYQYEDVNLGETDARKLPSVPQPDLQSEDDTEYEVPDMFEEYTGVHMNTLGASKPITPRPMKITEYKTFMGRERSKVISEIAQQYMALKTGQQHPWTAAIKLQNKPKNFFKALLPYDHSRVRLDTDGSDVRSDYINASYIKNHQGKVSFIAAQGPREGTKNDFWRMVWQEDVEIIVMLVDKDGTEQPSKGTQYWPDRVKTSEEYCDITVLLMESTSFRTHTVRKMNVLKGNERVHTVRQYEIPCWKYGGVPSEPADLISVIKQIKNHQNGGKHLLVHCSNGVGATGAFISLYDLMDVIKTKKEVCVFHVIEGMRKDRVNMVLTKLQYLFIFDALLEAMLSPDSQMSCDQLKKLDLSAMKAKCKKEFQILQETTKHQVDLATLAGNSSENNYKNRFPDLLPVDKFRPVLKSPGNVFCSNDYINATFAKDISQRGFIMTQTPLSSTIEDIWRLVFDYNCTSIVMLNTIDDSDESVTVYWPIGHNAASSHGLMTVICKKIDESDVFTRRQFEVKHKRSQKSLLVDHFSFHGWPGNKPDVHKLREFIKYTRTKGTGPALVHCINGVGLSAVYVTVISELERIDKEGAVDVFRTLHRLRKQSPYAVQTQDEYLLCYELLRDHLNNPEEYAVVF